MLSTAYNQVLESMNPTKEGYKGAIDKKKMLNGWTA